MGWWVFCWWRLSSPDLSYLLSRCISSDAYIALQSTNKSDFLFLYACSSHLFSSHQNQGVFFLELIIKQQTCTEDHLVILPPVWLSLQNSVVLSAAIFITLLGLLGYLHFVKIDQETLLIIDSLGIQMTSSYASGKESTTFIEMDKVKDVIINEAIYMVSI